MSVGHRTGGRPVGGLRLAAQWGVVAACALAVSAPSAMSAQAPSQGQWTKVQTTGTGTLVVQVVDAETGAAIRNARVVVSLLAPPAGGTPVPPPRDGGAAPGRNAAAAPMVASVDGAAYPDSRPAGLLTGGRTDRSGTAVITGLPSGSFRVSVLPTSGFVSGETPQPVQLADGRKASLILRLSRGGVISGRLFDEEGDAVIGASVRVIRRDTGGAVRPMATGVSYGTNDLGQFRVWGLPAGDYVVSANAPAQDVPGENVATREGNLSTFYPGVAAFDAAKTVTVKAGRETGGVDFTIVAGRFGSVAVRVVDASGVPLGAPDGGESFCFVSVFPRKPHPGVGGWSGSFRPDGTWVIRDVPPGDYYATATVTRTRNTDTRNVDTREAAYVPISVNGDEVAVTVQTHFGATIAGRVVVEGNAPAPAGGEPGSQSRRAPLTVSVRNGLEINSFPVFASRPPAPVGGDGAFELGGVRGRVHVVAEGGGAALKAVTRAGRDVGGQPLELAGAERVDDIVIVMTRETGGISGTVTDREGKPVGAATVVIFPDEPDRWAVGSPFVRQVRSGAANGAGTDTASRPGSSVGVPATDWSADAPGAFLETMLPAGRYAVVAFPPGTYLAPDRESLSRWRESAKVVTVTPGQTTMVEVGVSK